MFFRYYKDRSVLPEPQSWSADTLGQFTLDCLLVDNCEGQRKRNLSKIMNIKLRNWNVAVDVWAIGCILAEMILRRILFPGTDRLDQWDKITQVLGTPNKEFTNKSVLSFYSFFQECSFRFLILPSIQGL